MSYRMEHRAPGPESGAPLYDLTGNGVYPQDFYTNPHWYPADHRSDGDALSVIFASREKPERRVWIYRAVPKGVLDFNPGDWVAITKAYAIDHGKEQDPSQDMPVIAMRVKASQIFTAGDSYQEWGYDGPAVRGRVVYRPRKPLTEEQKEKRLQARQAKRRAERAKERGRGWMF